MGGDIPGGIAQQPAGIAQPPLNPVAQRRRHKAVIVGNPELERTPSIGNELGKVGDKPLALANQGGYDHPDSGGQQAQESQENQGDGQAAAEAGAPFSAGDNPLQLPGQGKEDVGNYGAEDQGQQYAAQQIQGSQGRRHGQ